MSPPVVAPPTPLQLAKNEVCDVLMSRAAQAIDFKLGTYHIDGTGYFEVMRAIQSERIDIVFFTLPSGAAAGYNDRPYSRHPARDALLLPETRPTIKLDYHANILHECTHAIIDMRQSAGTRGDNEAAAHVAAELFRLNSGDTGEEMFDPFKTARNIARAIRPRPGAAVSTADRTAMIQALVAGGYKQKQMDKPDTADGLARPPVIPRIF